MPWEVKHGAGCSGATPWAVVRADTGAKVACHPSKGKAQAHMRALYSNVDVAHEKGLDAALDMAFPRARRLAARVMIPAFRAWFMLGWGAATEEVERTKANDELLTLEEILALYPSIGEQINAVDAAAEVFIRDYYDEWWGRLEETTRERLRAAIETARTQGLQPEDVADLIEDQFGRARAELIATTEVTRLVGGGMHASYQAAGLTRWEWQTVRDQRVCPICEPRDGQRYGITQRFEPAHPRCRCFPRPVLD